MIPAFDDRGCLPPGVHGATVEETADRFGQETELRKVQMESLRWLVDEARRARIVRIVVNGSFVTDVPEPNDVDCVLLAPTDLGPDDPALADLLAGLAFISMQVVDQAGFDVFVNHLFATDRDTVSKGMIEILP
jgi:hypothetical protein